MSVIAFLRRRFAEYLDEEALVWQGRSYIYRELLDRLDASRNWLKQEGITSGSVVSLEADFSPRSIALMLALIESSCIVVPLTSTVEAKKTRFLEVAEVEQRLILDTQDGVRREVCHGTVVHPLLRRLREAGRPGLVLFSSGSTGESKAALHDFLPLLEKFKAARQRKRMINFLLFDHIGGVNTLLYCLSNGGCVITLDERSPDVVLAAIERHRAEILPTSPTFLNLLLVSGSAPAYDLSSLELVTYGTEVMPESTLRRFREAFPSVRLQQTYGLSELGILRSKSRSSDSLWVKIGGEGFQTRVVEGKLEIKAESAMLGYLNAPSPFTEDGWFMTGDRVEVDGEYFRILGRDSEIINVGGEKVYPAEVESIIQTMPGVRDVSVSAEPNPFTGQMVKARVQLTGDESLGEFRRRLRAFCRGKLENFKIPQKIVLVDEGTYGGRFKRMRKEA